MRLKFTRTARKHKIGIAHALYVMQGEPTESTRPSGETELSWIGTDETGRELHIIAVVITDNRTGEPMTLVIHVMPTALGRKGNQS